MEERSKWELFKEDVEMWLDLAICAAVFGLAYSLGKNICDRMFSK